MRIHAELEVLAAQATQLTVKVQQLRKLPKEDKDAVKFLLNTISGKSGKQLKEHLEDLIKALNQSDHDFGRQAYRMNRNVATTLGVHRNEFGQMSFYEELEMKAIEEEKREQREKAEAQKRRNERENPAKTPAPKLVSATIGGKSADSVVDASKRISAKVAKEQQAAKTEEPAAAAN